MLQSDQRISELESDIKQIQYALENAYCIREQYRMCTTSTTIPAPTNLTFTNYSKYFQDKINLYWGNLTSHSFDYKINNYNQITSENLQFSHNRLKNTIFIYKKEYYVESSGKLYVIDNNNNLVPYKINGLYIKWISGRFSESKNRYIPAKFKRDNEDSYYATSGSYTDI